MIHVAVTWYGLKYIATQDYAWYVSGDSLRTPSQSQPTTYLIN